MGKCSFGNIIVNDIFEAKYPFGTNLEGRFLYLEDGEQRWLLAVFDFSGTFRRTCLQWREAVSRATDIPIANIWYHELQIHAAPISEELEGKPCEKLIEICIPVIKDMISKAEDAELSHIIIDFEGRFNLNREQYVPGLGSVTVWAGLQFDSEGRPYTKNPDLMNLDGYKPDIPAFERNIYFDRPADPQGALLVFRSKTGKVLGTLTRFAAHPDVAVLFESMGIADQYRYHFDWPGYVREAIESSIGGMGLYVNGPCGNLSIRKGYEGMCTYEACDAEAYRIGYEIAMAFLLEWEKIDPVWEDIKINGIISRKLDLPIRESIPTSLEDSRKRDMHIKEAEVALYEAIKNNESPAEIKRLIDEKMHHMSIETIVNTWVGLSEAELLDRRASVEIEAISLNGLVFAGLPGECLTETCQWIKAQSIGNKLVVLDQVNGYMGYMVTSEAYDQGGYSYWGSMLRRDAERIMKKSALELIRSL